MFTGIVEEIGIVKSIINSYNSSTIMIEANKILQDIKLGDSISTNGVCLTVTDYDNKSFTVDVMPETINKSNLKKLKKGSKVNLERALKVGDRLGGHIVTGHIDGVGIIGEFKKDDNAIWVSISTSEDILKYIVYKGSIAIDGISLTVAYVDKKQFKVSIIPHTQHITTLVQKNIGDEVNLECDMIGKYIEKFLNLQKTEDSKQGLDITFLKENGFI
ncbi:riboflavin synthase [Caldisalinibacter kiritimatiensis]|uniref:Riboflavin synthase n=1 Tax=Caldisalinibacter kiritimatiensis TaxID=1304284 RepID=R1CWH4_9FIRM|nr:riboflavin synthase [Caldisalinibacter kiritimatiensis]EOD00969.1 Riboflavin synthase eubacterial/eukaryotic [Caldisalinibacter kiritimatiensis]